MPKVYLIRHAETERTGDDAFYWPLSARGEEQVGLLARQAFWDEISAVVSSDEPKSLATVARTARERGLPVHLDARLRELRRTPEHLEDYEARVLEVLQKPALGIGGWEPAADAQRRVSACFDELVARYGETPFAVVSHGMSLSLLIASLQETPARAFDIWQTLGFASVVLVERSPIAPLS